MKSVYDAKKEIIQQANKDVGHSKEQGRNAANKRSAKEMEGTFSKKC